MHVRSFLRLVFDTAAVHQRPKTAQSVLNAQTRPVQTVRPSLGNFYICIIMG
jgi:hypothetical protein